MRLLLSLVLSLQGQMELVHILDFLAFSLLPFYVVQTAHGPSHQLFF